jgi:aminoglycoside phosphotransferase (APT) family kinase protein
VSTRAVGPVDDPAEDPAEDPAHGRADGRAGIDAALVRRLVATQFPEWAGLPVCPVVPDGWDNRTYRLGDELTVRLPTGAGYVPAVEKEARWLPVLGPVLPLPVPEPVATGEPGEGYPYAWSVRRWLPGAPARVDRIDDLDRFAVDLAGFLLALEAADPTGGPPAGAHSFHRGAPLRSYDAETRRVLGRLARNRPALQQQARLDPDVAVAVWETALEAPWSGPPVWFHGDVASDNLLVDRGRLCAVIDFGTCGVGDPACDLVMAWTFFSGASRDAFRAALGHDDATWARARGWALWKALISLPEDLEAQPVTGDLRTLEAVLADHLDRR